MLLGLVTKFKVTKKEDVHFNFVTFSSFYIYSKVIYDIFGRGSARPDDIEIIHLSIRITLFD